MQDFLHSDANAATDVVSVNNDTCFATNPQLHNIFKSIITVRWNEPELTTALKKLANRHPPAAPAIGCATGRIWNLHSPTSIRGEYMLLNVPGGIYGTGGGGGGMSYSAELDWQGILLYCKGMLLHGNRGQQNPRSRPARDENRA